MPISRLAVAALGLIVAASAHAEVVLDTGLRPVVALRASYDDTDGGGDVVAHKAGRFVLARGAMITGVTVWFAGLNPSFTIMPGLGSTVDPNPAHNLWASGTGVETPITDPAFALGSSVLMPRQIDYSGLSFRIEAGTYWLGDFAAGGPDFGKRSILFAGLGDGRVATRGFGPTWTTAAGLQVALRLTGTLDPTGPGVPEPETWLLLIAGFGLVGTAARARRQTAG